MEQTDAKFRNPDEHALYLMCMELYRVLDLATRYKGFMVEVFSRFRTRNHFDEMLQFRFFGADLGLVSRLDPEIVSAVLCLFNYLYELRVSLKYTSALPPSVEMELDHSLSKIRDMWNPVTEKIEARYGWKFKSI